MENILVTDGVCQYYRHSDLRENQPTVLFLHGLGETGQCFAAALDRPDLAGLNLVIPDLAGFGKTVVPSPKEETFSLTANRDRIWTLIKALKLTDITLVGHSIGGDLGVLMCESDGEGRISRFINIEGNLCQKDMFISLEAATADNWGVFDAWFHDYFSAHFIPEKAKEQRGFLNYLGALRQANPDAFRIIAQEVAENHGNGNPNEISDFGKRYLKLEKLKVFYWGDQGLCEETRQIIAQNNLDNVRFNHSGHWVMYDRADAFYKLLLRSVTGVAGEASNGFFPANFKRYLCPRLEDIIDPAPELELDKPKHCYTPYMNQVATQQQVAQLDPFRELARQGKLEESHYGDMNQFLEREKKSISKDNLLEGYSALNTLAMTISQILFVNNCVVEGMQAIIQPQAKDQLQVGIAAYFQGQPKKKLTPGNAAFFADLFIYQVCFDRLFLMVEEPLSFDPKTKKTHLSVLYERYTRYLELSNKKVVTASELEKRLCYNITTGWGEDIDRETWQNLNNDYYSSTSKQDEPKLFTKYYDDMLERMLPQFEVSKFILAETIVEDLAAFDGKVRVLEIGSGSGSFAVDLQRVCLQRDLDLEKFVYHGLEPSADMRANFDDQFHTKVGRGRPSNWSSQEGDLEKVIATPSTYLKSDAGECTVAVFCYSAHHCYHESLRQFLTSNAVRQLTKAIYILDVTLEHGWTKPYYMWVDCESPENFDNVTLQGDWEIASTWSEPGKGFKNNALTNAWCTMRKLV